MRSLAVAAAFAASVGVAAAQQAPAPPPPRADSNVTLRAIPAGPGKPAAELTTRFGTLEVTVGDCLVNTPDAPPESTAYLTIVDHKPGQPEEKLFTGWMFASTPSLSALDHGVYDVRVLACTMAQGSTPPRSR
jgi:hypothetical protein